MQQGFNTGATYRATDPTNPWRDKILSLKLRVAHGLFFPFIVVGSKEFEDISGAAQVGIVDTIIGSIVAGNAIAERVKYFDPSEIGMSEEEFDQLSPPEQDEVVQDWFIGVEAEADCTLNPVFRAVHDLHAELSQRTRTRHGHVRFVHQPNIDDAKTTTERVERLEKVILNGAEYTLTTEQYGEIKATAWLPNFNSPGFSEYGFLFELAELAALEKLRKRVNARD
jgi:hypothetical protein